VIVSSAAIVAIAALVLTSGTASAPLGSGRTLHLQAGRGVPGGVLGDELAREFGSFERFKKEGKSKR